jgi:pseudouridine-5'-phosphate glycosidase
VFATGGIGGVHRGAEYSFDISADLTELGRTPVLVVCAGVKSILDIPKTLEVLETQGERYSGYIPLSPSSPSSSSISLILC